MKTAILALIGTISAEQLMKIEEASAPVEVLAQPIVRSGESGEEPVGTPCGTSACPGDYTVCCPDSQHCCPENNVCGYSSGSLICSVSSNIPFEL
jgi:hypothetical protein